MTRTPPHPLVLLSAPWWVRWTQTALAWLGVACAAAVFWQLGAAMDAGGAGLGHLVGAAAFAALAALSTAFGTWFSEHAQGAAERRLRHAVVARTFDLGVRGEREASGARLTLATDAVERAAQYRAGFLGPILGALTAPFVVLLVMGVTVDATTAALLALTVLVVPLVVAVFQRLAGGSGAAYGRSMARLGAAFLEAVQALETLVYTRSARRKAEELAAEGESHRRALMRMLAANQVLILVLDAAFALLVTLTAALVALGRVQEGTLTSGQALAILGMTVFVVAPVDVVGQFFYIGIGGRAASTHLSALFATTGARESPRPSSQRSDGEILLAGVTAGWPGGPPVLTDVTLRVRAGERVALVGPSGIGKSTLAAVLQGHLEPRSGRVTVDGVDAVSYPSTARARLAVVSQRHFLFDDTVAGNLRLANPSADDVTLHRALRLAGLDDEIERLGGLSAPVGENGSRLSGGQAQRLAIARAALRDAPVLLLDEPTSQVDLAAEAEILEALGRLCAGKSVLMIAHRPGAILSADRVVAMTGAGVRS